MKQDFRSALIALLVLLPGPVGQAKASRSEQGLSGISGVVTNSVTGEPLGYARVDLESGGGQNPIRYSAMTTSDGHFAIRDVPAGRYQISLKYRKYVADPTSTKAIELSRDEQVHDMNLKLVPPGAILGRVVDELGAPLENVFVRAESQGSMQSAFTDEQGQFRIGGLRPGSYWMVASPPQSRMPPEIRTDGTVELNYAPTYYPGALKRAAASRIDVSGGAEVRGIELALRTFPIFKVSGWVSGVPQDALCADVMLSSDHSGSGVVLASDRRFTIWRLPPGSYSLSAQCQDLADRPLRSASVPFEISNSNVENIELLVAPPFNLNGQVQLETWSHETSKAPHSRSVRLRNQQSRFGEAQAEINPDGIFRFTDVTLGRYHINLEGFPANAYVRSIRIGLLDVVDNVIDLRSGPPREPITVLVGRAEGKISGTVHGTKELVDKASVVLINETGSDFPRTAVIRPDRSYLFEGVPPGKYKVLAIDQGDIGLLWQNEDLTPYKEAIETVDVDSNEQVTRDLNVFVLESGNERSDQ